MHFLQFFRRACQHRMAERIEPGLIRTDFVARLVLDAFANDDDAILVRRHRLLDLGEKTCFVERQFRQQNDMRRIGGHAALGEHRARRDPAGGTAHHLDDAARAVIRGHRADIKADFHDRGGVELDHRAVTRAVIRMRQIIINRLRHTDDAHS
jgi:hypothetical protein